MGEVLVLYHISNEFGPTPPPGHAAPSYNAYRMPVGPGGVTLASAKSGCAALRMLSPDGADGYHWRVRIDERPGTSHSSGGGGTYSWWDVQDERARLPVKEATPGQLRRLVAPPRRRDEEGDAVTQEVTKAAKGAMKYMSKAANMVAGSSGHHSSRDDDDDDEYGPRTSVIVFKLVDLSKCRGSRGGAAGGGGRTASARAAPAPRRQANPPRAPSSTGAPRQQTRPQRAPPAPAAATADLMGFNSPPRQHPASAPPSSSGGLRHAGPAPSVSAAAQATGRAHPSETRAQKLKREYARKQATTSRVWDEVDQRWVEGPVRNGEAKPSRPASAGAPSAASGGGVDAASKGVKGISLSRSNAAGKSAGVQAAVSARVDEMEQSQARALAELRQRQGAEERAKAEEDLIRQRLEPRLRAWSEEHGKKKQLRALLANLHTILWEGSGWRQISLADVLDDSKVKRVYFKASRVVHPDKTGKLDAEKRFVAKRVFDALTQAKVEFDEGKR